MTIYEQEQQRADEAREQMAREHKLQRLAAHVDSDLSGLPDYELANIEARRFLMDLEIKAVPRGGFEDRTPEGWDHRFYSVLFTRGSRRATFNWKQGMGIHVKPNGAEVLCSVCRDYMGTEGRTLKEWADEYGYESDSIVAEDAYRESLRLGEKIKALGITDEQMVRLSDYANRF